MNDECDDLVEGLEAINGEIGWIRNETPVSIIDEITLENGATFFEIIYNTGSGERDWVMGWLRSKYVIEDEDED